MVFSFRDNVSVNLECTFLFFVFEGAFLFYFCVYLRFFFFCFLINHPGIFIYLCIYLYFYLAYEKPASPLGYVGDVLAYLRLRQLFRLTLILCEKHLDKDSRLSREDGYC